MFTDTKQETVVEFSHLGYAFVIKVVSPKDWTLHLLVVHHVNQAYSCYLRFRNEVTHQLDADHLN